MYKSIRTGDLYEFNMNRLETSKDLNVQAVTRALLQLQETMDLLKSLNGIKDEEVG